MKCSKCGTEFNGAFCPQCGTPAPSGWKQLMQTDPISLIKNAIKKLKPHQLLIIIIGVPIALLTGIMAIIGIGQGMVEFVETPSNAESSVESTVLLLEGESSLKESEVIVSEPDPSSEEPESSVEESKELEESSTEESSAEANSQPEESTVTTSNPVESSTQTDSSEAVSEPPVSSNPPAENTDPSNSGGGGSGNANNFNAHDNPEQQKTESQWVLNTKSKKIHYPSCSEVKKIAPQNYSTSNLSEDELKSQGYTTCGRCH